MFSRGGHGEYAHNSVQSIMLRGGAIHVQYRFMAWNILSDYEDIECAGQLQKKMHNFPGDGSDHRARSVARSKK